MGASCIFERRKKSEKNTIFLSKGVFLVPFFNLFTLVFCPIFAFRIQTQLCSYSLQNSSRLAFGNPHLYGNAADRAAVFIFQTVKLEFLRCQLLETGIFQYPVPDAEFILNPRMDCLPGNAEILRDIGQTLATGQSQSKRTCCPWLFRSKYET